MIPFEFTVPEAEIEGDLGEHLQSVEGPGILQWAIEGCLDWQANGLNPPLRVMATTSEYFEDEDKLGTFLNDCLEVGTGNREVTARIYQRYKEWCESNGEYAESRKRFVEAMKRKGYRSRNLGGQMIITGIKLPDAYNPYNQ